MKILHARSVDLFLKNEQFKNVKEEILDLLKDHFNEVSPFRHTHEFKPDLKYYDYVDETTLKLFLAYIGDELVGYNAYILGRHTHVDAMFAYQEVIYVKPKHRGFGVGEHLVRFADIMLKNYGAEFVINSFNSDFDMGNLLEKQEYKLMDKVFIKRLG